MSVEDFHVESGLEEYAEKSKAAPTPHAAWQCRPETCGGIHYDPCDDAVPQQLRTRPEDQPLPTDSTEAPCHEAFLQNVNRDTRKRLEIGLQRYNQPLRPLNGRDFGQDAWEEYLDLGAYFTGLMQERELLIEKLTEATRALRAAGAIALAADYERVLAGMGRSTKIN